MKHGRFDSAAEVLRQIIQYSRRAPTRIMRATGVPYHYLNDLLSSGLVQVYLKKKRSQLILKDKGREFLQAYRMCEKLARGTPQSIN
jgi:predicted transcriptional regulator